MKLYKLLPQDIKLIQAGLNALSRAATEINLYTTNIGEDGFINNIEFDTAKLSALIQQSEVYIEKDKELIKNHSSDTGFDFDSSDFEAVIDNGASIKPLSDEAKAKVQSLWWKSHDDYLKLRNEQDQGIWDDLSEDHKRMAREQQYKECQMWNEIMSLARATADNTNE